uniref:endosome-associated-trafficking regulator 1-like isoform X2 n=1 Tax=Jaculus jaculus TaxID=51337 RepID=UPI001E1AF585|nr:endosome-associated-trafficking regulator 1-like isoform X2 [Jaculus jaculus]
MAGYTRRPSASPLWRTRSLMVPEGEGSSVRPQSWSLAAPAFYGCRRGSAVPQLAGERGHSRPLPSRLVRFRPSVMCCVPSRVLASVGDADFADKLEDLDQTSPFSFKELLKTKNLSLSTEDPSTNSRIYLKEAARHPRGLAHSSPPFQTLGYGLEPRRPFFEDLAGVSVLEEEDEWDGAYQSSTLEPTRASRTPGSMSPYLSFLSTASELARSQSLPPWMLSDTDSCVSLASPARSPVIDFEAHRESLGDRHLRTLQINYEALKEDNSKLRRKLNEVQSFSETQTEMVRILEWKLEAEMVKEESDFHDLKSVVQQVEQNLELMTKRAVKAENQVTKLKQEVSSLQTQISNFKRENEALQSGQGTSLKVVKQNLELALQNLRVVMNSAHSSIKQLVAGAETMNLVAEILKSVDRISEVNEEEK